MTKSSQARTERRVSVDAPQDAAENAALTAQAQSQLAQQNRMRILEGAVSQRLTQELGAAHVQIITLETQLGMTVQELEQVKALLAELQADG